MIKNSLKNFAKNLLLLFVPMGIFYLFMIAAIFGSVSSVLGSMQKMLADLVELIHLSAEQSSASVNEFLAYSLNQLDWNGSLLAVARQILSSGWLQTTLQGFFQTLNASTAGFEEQISAIAHEFLASLHTTFAFAVTTLCFGLACANYATRFVIRRNTVKGSLKKFIIAHTLVPLAETVLFVAALCLLAVLRVYGLPLLFAILLLTSGISLTASWLIQRDGTLRLKDILTPRNVLSQLAAFGSILLIDIAVAVVLFLIDPLFAVLLLIPLVLYSQNIVDVNCDSYIAALIRQNKLP